MKKYAFYMILAIFLSSCATLVAYGPFSVNKTYGDPAPYGEGIHPGIDFAISTGTPIIAVSDGNVNYVGERQGRENGIFVSVWHRGDFRSLYGHLSMRLRINIVSKLGMGPEIADHVTLWTNRAEFLDTPQGQQAVKTIHEAVMKNEPIRYIAMLRSVLHWGRVLPEQKGEPKFTARLPGIRVPTLAVSGDSDHFIPASLSKMIAAKIPGARYHEIAQCGHIAVHEKPEETARVLADFINKV